MKIYTKTGDDGSTGLYGGKRVSKHDLRVEAYGTVDELNAWIGLINDENNDDHLKTLLKEIQDRLFTIGAHLASDPQKKLTVPDIKESDILMLETEIDRMNDLMPVLRHFVLPGGHTRISHIHIGRTVCRRAERCIIALHVIEAVEQDIIIYINRLSDYLFILSRFIAHQLGVEEVKWIPRK